MHKFLPVLLLAVCLVQCQKQSYSIPDHPSLDSVQSASVIPRLTFFDSFGTNTHKFKAQKFTVSKNGSLYTMLKKLDIPSRRIHHIIQKAKNVVDFQAFRPGQKYRAYFSDKDHSLKKIVWQPNALQYVTFSWLKDSLQIYRASRIKSQKTNVISGTIQSSVYNAISDAASRNKLVYDLTDILAWEIDFTTLRKGDSFRIVYNKNYVDGQFFDTGRILAIKLNHRGKTYYAYYFNNSKFEGYYDEGGHSVQKALLKMPFKYDHRITSHFNHHRLNPVTHHYMPHTGVDYGTPVGTPVLATGKGVVLEAHYGGAAGNIVKIRHNATYTTAYMHLSKFASGIHRGVHVNQGQVIGYSGATGRVTGPNLHYSVYKKGKAVNPLTLKLPPAKSISSKYMAAFQKDRNRLDRKLTGEKFAASDSLQDSTAL
jgi:murein DD-endopeptidase MepM/ murein hydrolase activator NlpD